MHGSRQQRRRRVLGYGLLPGTLVLLGSSLPLPRTLEIVDYADERISVYSDRSYANTRGHELFRGLRLVRLPRHHQHDVRLRSDRPLTVYRLLTPRNRNDAFAGWQREAFEALVEGRSCTFREVVSKPLPAGEHRLVPGGPVAASPLLVRSDDPVLHARSLYSWNRIYPPGWRTSNGVPFHTSKKTLLGWALVWALLAGGAALRIERRAARARSCARPAQPLRTP